MITDTNGLAPYSGLCAAYPRTRSNQVITAYDGTTDLDRRRELLAAWSGVLYG